MGDWELGWRVTWEARVMSDRELIEESLKI